MAQRKHLDDFYVVELLDDWNDDVPSWKYPKNLESLRVSSPGFGNDSKMMVMWIDVTAQVAPELQRRMRTGHIGLYARRPVKCVPLTATHCRLRLTWNRELALWTPQQWSCMMFSDESMFSLQSDSRRTLIWRASGTRYHQENTIERHCYGGAGWLAFGEELFLFPETDLHVQSVTMTRHTFIGISFWNNMYVCFGAPWVLNFCLWMTTPVLAVQTL
ncbi:HTH_Tnp_Tc3_2 domain-containing protein [Trichonephila clavipes]|nr:HTH_Tnp_Tc3_2 domain-containing protein [Trichonephila clavipes]